MSPLTRACSIWVNFRSGMAESFEAPSIRLIQPRADGAGNCTTSLESCDSTVHRTMAVTAGSEAAYSS